MKNIIFIAPPAAGKGTQSAILEKKYHLPHISTGDVLRKESLEDTELGRYIREVMTSGGLVKDEVTYDLLLKRLSEKDCQNGYVLDGYPRNIEQAYKYDEMLKELHQTLGYVILLDISEDILEKRITGRRICKSCNAVYNINSETESPKEESICDKCGSRLYQRNDDNIEAFQTRYKMYQEKTEPIIEHYRKQGVLFEVNGNDTVENVFQEIDKIISSSNNSTAS